MGRSRAQAPTARGVAGARGPADGVAFRCASGRFGEHPRRDVRYRTAVADDADAFTEKYGIPVLTSYAATEFGGGVAGWTLADYQKYWHAKRGSVGRANPGAQLRVVDDDGTRSVPTRPACWKSNRVSWGRPRTGCAPRIWRASTLTVSLDPGRADQAIIRGGFKVMPDDVRTALESHPAVAGAAVVGRPDDRLGETPVAMVELRDPPRPNPTRWSNFCERGWRATRFPPTSRSSTRSREPRRARPIWARSGAFFSDPPPTANMPVTR